MDVLTAFFKTPSGGSHVQVQPDFEIGSSVAFVNKLHNSPFALSLSRGANGIWKVFAERHTRVC